MASRLSEREQWECARKRKFNSERRARKEAQFILRRFNDKLHAYFCRWCAGWHLGH